MAAATEERQPRQLQQMPPGWVRDSLGEDHAASGPATCLIRLLSRIEGQRFACNPSLESEASASPHGGPRVEGLPPLNLAALKY